MSHTTVINGVRVMDPAVMQLAVERLAAKRKVKLEFQRGGEARMWSSKVKCAFVVKVPDCRFDVGFVPAEDGNGYVPVFDAHGRILYERVGGGMDLAKTHEEHMLSNIGGLLQEYTREAVTRVAQNNGAMVHLSEQPDGNMVLQLQ